MRIHLRETGMDIFIVDFPQRLPEGVNGSVPDRRDRSRRRAGGLPRLAAPPALPGNVQDGRSTDTPHHAIDMPTIHD
jgi:hypothetical protein